MEGPMLPVRTFLSAVLRRYPFSTGYEAIGLSKPLALFARNEQYSVAYLRNGAKMLVYGKDHVGRILLYMGDFEPRITWVAEALLRPGDTVLDIGANMGWFTITAANLVGPTGRVHAFEPQPRLNTLHRASLAMNEFDNVTVHELALSSSDGTAELHVLKGNLGAARLGPGEGELWSTIKVPTVNAGEYFNSLGLQSIRLLKIDVEGHEQTVFEAGGDFFRRTPPDAIIFESAGDEPLSERPIGKTIAGLGYRLYSLQKGLKPTLVPASKAGTLRTIDHVALYDGPRLKADLAALGVEA